MTSPWISLQNVNFDSNFGDRVKEMGSVHQVLDEMTKRDGKKRSRAVSPHFLKLVEYLL